MWQRLGTSPTKAFGEVRGGPQHFVYSKVMTWVAFDRAAIMDAQARGESGLRWRQIADEIHAQICERGFDLELNSFVQAYGSKRLDASLLLIPLVGFLPAEDSRVRGTFKAIEDKLLIDGEFVLRYAGEDASDGLACSFWLVGNYILQGRYADARKLFECLLSRCNDVGLLAEEIDPLTGRMLGNFPQAYSHVSLINCALSLSRQGPDRGARQLARAASCRCAGGRWRHYDDSANIAGFAGSASRKLTSKHTDLILALRPPKLTAPVQITKPTDLAASPSPRTRVSGMAVSQAYAAPAPLRSVAPPRVRIQRPHHWRADVQCLLGARGLFGNVIPAERAHITSTPILDASRRSIGGA